MTARKDILQKHIRSNHIEKNIKCEHCDYVTNDNFSCVKTNCSVFDFVFHWCWKLPYIIPDSCQTLANFFAQDRLMNVAQYNLR